MQCDSICASPVSVCVCVYVCVCLCVCVWAHVCVSCIQPGSESVNTLKCERVCVYV